jgi:hypothetical protein
MCDTVLLEPLSIRHDGHTALIDLHRATISQSVGQSVSWLVIGDWNKYLPHQQPWTERSPLCGSGATDWRANNE